MSDDLTPNEAAALEEIMWELSAPHTLEAIAARLGIDPRTVSTIEKRALGKMRNGAAREWAGGLRDPDLGLHRACDEVTPSDGMTRTTRRS